MKSRSIAARTRRHALLCVLAATAIGLPGLAGAQLNLGVGALVGDLPQALGQGGGVHRRFVQIDLAGGIDRQRLLRQPWPRSPSRPPAWPATADW